MHRIARVGLWIVGLTVAAIFLKAMLAQYGTGGRGDGSWYQPRPFPAALVAAPSRALADSLGITVRPHASAFDSTFVADITINNQSASAVAGITLTCDALSDDGTTIGHAAVSLRDTFPPHAITTESAVELRFVHRPASARCALATHPPIR